MDASRRAALHLRLEHGGVSALVNIRGGGEYGEAWHNAARRAHRQVAYDDFLAAGDWLVANQVTSTAYLGATGTSGGGMLVAGALVQRPDRFGAVVPVAGVHDLLRFHRFGQGAGWQSDLGSIDDPAEFAALRATSPLHNVRPAPATRRCWSSPRITTSGSRRCTPTSSPPRSRPPRPARRPS
jgi:prolyl oligopeptidase